jgi:hemerythrin-like domain-containing protein
MTARAPKPARPARPAAPPMPELDALDKTHRQVMVVLAELHQLIEHLDRAGVDTQARQMAKDICKFFSGSARQHHADEERIVFPGLLKSPDAALVQHVLRLQQDHGWLEEDWLEIEPQLQAVAEGYSWYDLDTLRAALPIFEDLYREHIALEESLIYPEARRQRQLADEAAAARSAASS